MQSDASSSRSAHYIGNTEKARKIKVFQILVYKILIKFIKSLYSSAVSAVSAVGFKNTKKHSKECFFRLAKSFNCYLTSTLFRLFFFAKNCLWIVGNSISKIKP